MQKQIREIRKKRLSTDRIFDIVNLFLMMILLAVFVWPLWFMLIASFSDPIEVWAGNVLLLPRKITPVAYERLLQYKMIWAG